MLGVEPAVGSREAAHRLFGGLDVRDGSADDSGFDAASADVVVAVGVTSLLDDLDALFAEARRLLRPGGFLGIVDMFLAGGDVEIDGPNTLRSVAEDRPALARAAGFATELVRGRRRTTDDAAGRTGPGERSARPLVEATDAAPSDRWAPASARLTAEVVADHPGAAAVDAWLADRRKLAGWIDSGHVVAACLTLSPVEDAGPRRSRRQAPADLPAGPPRRVLGRGAAHAPAGRRRGGRARTVRRSTASPPRSPRTRTIHERVMRALGVEPKPIKEGPAKVAEQAGLLKRNGTLVRRSPLTTLVELEAMTIAVSAASSPGGRRCAPRSATDHLGGIDLGELIARSEEHLATLAEIHDRRAAAGPHPRRALRGVRRGSRGRRGAGA